MVKVVQISNFTGQFSEIDLHIIEVKNLDKHPDLMQNSSNGVSKSEIQKHVGKL